MRAPCRLRSAERANVNSFLAVIAMLSNGSRALPDGGRGTFYPRFRTFVMGCKFARSS